MTVRCVNTNTGAVTYVTGTCPAGTKQQDFAVGPGAGPGNGGANDLTGSGGGTTTYPTVTRPNIPAESGLAPKVDPFNAQGSPVNQPYQPWSGLVPDAESAWMPRQPTAQQQEYMGLAFNTQNPSTIARYQDPNSGINSTWASQSAADSGWYDLSKNQQSLFGYIAAQEAAAIGDKTPIGAQARYEEFVNSSAASVARGAPQTPYSLAYGLAVQRGWISEKGIAPLPSAGGGGGGGGAAGPTPYDQSTVKRMMDSLSNDLIGKTLSDEEFKRYYSSYTGAFSGNPEVDLQQHGTEALQADEGYQEYQVAGKFAKAFEGILRGAS